MTEEKFTKMVDTKDFFDEIVNDWNSVHTGKITFILEISRTAKLSDAYSVTVYAHTLIHHLHLLRDQAQCAD